MTPPRDDIESDLVDLAEVTLADLATAEWVAAEPVVRRLLRRVEEPDSNMTGTGGSGGGSRID